MADRDDHLVCAGVGYTLLNIYSECQRINVRYGLAEGRALFNASAFHNRPSFQEGLDRRGCVEGNFNLS
jgi:hypothetical protein